MASTAARAGRNRAARDRLDAAVQTIGLRLGVEPPAPSRRMHDSGLQPIVEIEWMADYLEAVLRAIPAGEAVQPAYGAATVAELRAEADRRGLTVPTGARKDDIVALLEEADADDAR